MKFPKGGVVIKAVCYKQSTTTRPFMDPAVLWLGGRRRGSPGPGRSRGQAGPPPPPPNPNPNRQTPWAPGRVGAGCATGTGGDPGTAVMGGGVGGIRESVHSGVKKVDHKTRRSGVSGFDIRGYGASTTGMSTKTTPLQRT